jgi:hypothetical protein
MLRRTIDRVERSRCAVDQHAGHFVAAQLGRKSSSTSAAHPPSAGLVCCLELIVNILVRD